MGNDTKIEVDRMGLVFAKVIRVLTIVAIIVLIVPAIFYFMGQRQYISLKKAALYWNESATAFWKSLIGKSVHGYGWIFAHIHYTDCLSLIGVMLLMITPLIGIIIAIPAEHRRAYRVLLSLISIEFIVAIILRGIL